jgi:26S proteasome regulatory subunit T2
LLRQERIKDYLTMEQEFIQNQERLKPQDEKKEQERDKVDAIRGTPIVIGTMEEIIDDEHAICTPNVGLEYYCPMLSFVDKD